MPRVEPTVHVPRNPRQLRARMWWSLSSPCPTTKQLPVWAERSAQSRETPGGRLEPEQVKTEGKRSLYWYAIHRVQHRRDSEAQVNGERLCSMPWRSTIYPIEPRFSGVGICRLF